MLEYDCISCFIKSSKHCLRLLKKLEIEYTFKSLYEMNFYLCMCCFKQNIVGDWNFKVKSLFYYP